MPLPKILGVQNAGVDPNEIQQRNDQSQKLKEIMSDIQIRLSNITNVRSTIQGGMYGAFGNNFLTRGATQIGDSISDAISSLFRGKEEQKDDPMVVALKQQTAILSRIETSSSDSTQAVNAVEDAIVLLRQDIKSVREADRLEFAKQDSILENILNALSASTKPSVSGHKARIAKAKTTSSITTKPLKSATIVTPPPPPPDQKIDNNDTANQTPLLKKILEILLKANKHLEKIVKIQPLSTKDAELEEIRLKNAAIRGRVGETVTDVDEGKRNNKFDFTRIFSGLLDFDANLMGLKKVFSIVTTGMGLMFDSLKAAVSPLISLLGRLGSSIISAVATITHKAPAAIGSVAKVAVNVAKSAKTLALPVALASAGLAAVDYGLGKAGVGGNEIDESQDDANWKKMSTGQKIESGIARGLEHVGDFMFMDNIANEAKANRIKRETAYLNEKSSVISKPNSIGSDIDLITKAQLEIERKKKTSSAAPSQNVVHDNRVTQNQTIMPTRTITENPEAGYRRYMDRVYSTSP